MYPVPCVDLASEVVGSHGAHDEGEMRGERGTALIAVRSRRDRERERGRE